MNTNKRKTESHPHTHDHVPVIMIRHAQSQWNQENRFTGWANPPLTQAGVAEAIAAGKWLKQHGYQFDIAYSSCLQRAITTLELLLDQLDQPGLPTRFDWRLNERHYGALQGVNKANAGKEYGEAQVHRWRRGYLDQATPLERVDPAHPANNPLYADVHPELLPGVENLAQTRERVTAFWHEQITPLIRQGQRIIISSHGNTLRALLMELGGMSVNEVEKFEIPTATPIAYHFRRDGRPLDWHYLATRTAESA